MLRNMIWNKNWQYLKSYTYSNKIIDVNWLEINSNFLYFFRYRNVLKYWFIIVNAVNKVKYTEDERRMLVYAMTRLNNNQNRGIFHTVTNLWSVDTISLNVLSINKCKLNIYRLTKNLKIQTGQIWNNPFITLTKDDDKR